MKNENVLWKWFLSIFFGVLTVFVITFLYVQAIHAKNVKTFYSFPNAQFVSVIDGDTIRVHIPSIHPLFGYKTRIRILGIDTPELRSKIKEERIKAKEAKEFVIKALTGSNRFRITDCLSKPDSFGRPLCKVSTKAIDDLGALLLENGFAKVYKK